MNKKILVPLIAAMALVATAATSFAYQDADNSPAPDPTQREAIMQAATAGDYQAWYDLITADGHEPRILEIITQDNFAEFSRMHQLMQEAKSIGDGLGLNNMRGMRFGGSDCGLGMKMRAAGQKWNSDNIDRPFTGRARTNQN